VDRTADAAARDLANERRRFGYRRLFILLRQEGEPSGINRIYRLYREEGLTVRKRRAQRRAVGTRTPIPVEARANARWSLNFVHDQLACGRRFRIMNVVDDVTRECHSAHGPDADRRCKLLTINIVSGAKVGADSHPIFRRAITGLETLPSLSAASLRANGLARRRSAWRRQKRSCLVLVDPLRSRNDRRAPVARFPR